MRTEIVPVPNVEVEVVNPPVAPPVSPEAVAVREDLSPAIWVAKLHPHRVIEIPRIGRIPGRVINEFWLIGGPSSGGMSQLQDRSVKRQCGDITILDNGTFNMAFYPNEGEPSIANGLPLSRLPDAVRDLLAAGFK